MSSGSCSSARPHLGSHLRCHTRGGRPALPLLSTVSPAAPPLSAPSASPRQQLPASHAWRPPCPASQQCGAAHPQSGGRSWWRPTRPAKRGGGQAGWRSGLASLGPIHPVMPNRAAWPALSPWHPTSCQHPGSKARTHPARFKACQLDSYTNSAAHLGECRALNRHAGGPQPALPHQLPQLHRAIVGGQPAVGHALQHLQQLRVGGRCNAVACTGRRGEGRVCRRWAGAAAASASQPWLERARGRAEPLAHGPRSAGSGGKVTMRVPRRSQRPDLLRRAQPAAAVPHIASRGGRWRRGERRWQPSSWWATGASEGRHGGAAGAR